MIKAFVGAGGKTSEIFKESEYFRNIGKRVFVCTSTHMLIDDNTLTVNINRIRKKLKDIGLDDFVKTKKGLGYMVC